jgi:hypothetical protein
MIIGLLSYTTQFSKWERMMMMRSDGFRLFRKGRTVFTLLALVSLLTLTWAPSVSAQNIAAAGAASGGFGAAFGFASSIGPISYTSTGSIGTGLAGAIAISPGGIFAASNVFSLGNAAAFAGSIATPFGASAAVLTTALGGFATGGALAVSP